jgi:hypothetical protein
VLESLKNSNRPLRNSAEPEKEILERYSQLKVPRSQDRFSELISGV